MITGNSLPATTLDARLAALPREAEPSRDLWPGILTEISAQPRRLGALRSRWPFALAAGILVACAAGYVGWLGGRSQPAEFTAGGPLTANRSESQRLVGFASPSGSGYVATRASLERSYAESLKLLAPPTRARIERDLGTIRDANADIQQALAADPQSPVLNRLLESIWQQEFNLYATVARISDPAAQRTRT